MKKILVHLLLLSFINLTGCYSHKLFAPSSYKFDEKKDISVITKDTTFNLRAYQYLLLNDTLLCTKKNIRITEATPNELLLRLPVEEIQLVEVTSAESGKTALVVIGVISVLVIVVLLIAASQPFGNLNAN